MSAIFAGDKCKICNESYYASLGHPEWFDNVVRGRKPPCEAYKRYHKLLRSGKCPYCITGWQEPGYTVVSLLKRITYGIRISRRVKKSVVARRITRRDSITK